MIDKGWIKAKKGLVLAPLPGRCPICDAAGATKLPRGPPIDTTELPVGTLWHLDFTFFNVTSIRGFTAVLVIVEATTRYLWFFPCRHKNAPIDLCLFFSAMSVDRAFPSVPFRVMKIEHSLATQNSAASCISPLGLSCSLPAVVNPLSMGQLKVLTAR